MLIKDLETTAKAIKEAVEGIKTNNEANVASQLYGAQQVVYSLADALPKDCPKVVRARFIKACGFTA
jgi:hypothetical protein